MTPLKFCRSDTDLLRCGEGLALQAGPQGLFMRAEGREPVRGAYLSAVYDSGTEGTEWNCLFLELDCGGRLRLSVLVYDELPSDCPLSGGDAPLAERLSWMREHAAVAAHTPDLLLYGTHGRYFRFALEALVPAGESLRFQGFEASFPKQTFADYLPQIYRGNPVLERYLGILQSVWMENERQIDGFKRKLSVPLTDGQTLRELARWVGAEEWVKGLPREQAEGLVKEAVWLHRRRGTRQALHRFLQLLTGETPTIVEPFQWEGLPQNVEEQRFFERLYGEEGSFVVLLGHEPAIGRERLGTLLRDFLPAGAACRIAFLDEEQPVGGHCYLGVNTRVSGGELPVLGTEGLRLGSVRLPGEPGAAQS